MGPLFWSASSIGSLSSLFVVRGPIDDSVGYMILQRANPAKLVRDNYEIVALVQGPTFDKWNMPYIVNDTKEARSSFTGKSELGTGTDN